MIEQRLITYAFFPTSRVRFYTQTKVSTMLTRNIIGKIEQILAACTEGQFNPSSTRWGCSVQYVFFQSSGFISWLSPWCSLHKVRPNCKSTDHISINFVVCNPFREISHNNSHATAIGSLTITKARPSPNKLCTVVCPFSTKPRRSYMGTWKPDIRGERYGWSEITHIERVSGLENNRYGSPFSLSKIVSRDNTHMEQECYTRASPALIKALPIPFRW